MAKSSVTQVLSVSSVFKHARKLEKVRETLAGHLKSAPVEFLKM